MSCQKKPVSLRNLMPKAGLGATTMLACAFSAAAYAEDKAEQVVLAPVVVEASEMEGAVNPYADPDAPYKIDRSSSSKFTEPLRDTAKAITVVPKEVIKDTAARSFRDVMRTQPGITLGTGEGGNAFGDRIFIRGFDARNDVFVDGLRDPGVAARETFAVEQIEILKGPSSLFAGRGTTGGAVNIVSKAPAATNFTEAEVMLGTDNTKRTSVDSNYVVNDKLAIRANGMLQDAGVAGRDKVEQNRWGGLLAMDYQATEKLKLGMDYYHLTTDDIPDWGMPYDTRFNQPFEGVNRDTFYGLVRRDFWDTETDIVTAKLEAQLNESVKLDNKLRYGRTTNAYVASAPERPDFSSPDPANWVVNSSPKNRNSETDYIANQTNLIFDFDTAKLGHTLVTGMEVSREEIENNPFTGFDSEAGVFTSINAVTQSILRPNPLLAWNVPAVGSNNFRNTQVDTFALYAMDTVKLNEKWEVFGGLRWDNYDIAYSETGLGRGGAPSTSVSNDSSFVNWHTGAVYKPVENGSIYIAYGSSSNPPGDQLDGSGDTYGGLSANSARLDPEENRLYELGTKWELFDGDLALDGSVFHIEKDNARILFGPRGSQILSSAGKMEVNGVEIGFAGRITPDWSLYGGMALLDTEITESPDPTLKGKKFPNIAETSFNLLTKYQLTDRWEIGGQAYYQGKVYGGSYAATTSYAPAYWRFDALSEYAVTESLDLRLNVLNLTDEVYYDAIYRSATPFAYIAPGRAGYLTLAYKF